ncbi:MAG: MotA/TolQ/ExbB proton channel family protein [Myxococcota bacterium]
MNAVVEAVLDLYRSGGFVMPWLVLANAALWYALGERAWLLRGRVTAGARRTITGLGTAEARREALDPTYALLRRNVVLIGTLTALAPLAGLLGTVTGMIETFDSLATMSLFRGSGGVAGGISEALVSTQMGLAVAIPGLLAGRLLDRRAERIREELDGLVEVAS